MRNNYIRAISTLNVADELTDLIGDYCGMTSDFCNICTCGNYPDCYTMDAAEYAHENIKDIDCLNYWCAWVESVIESNEIDSGLLACFEKMYQSLFILMYGCEE